MLKCQQTGALQHISRHRLRTTVLVFNQTPPLPSLPLSGRLLLLQGLVQLNLVLRKSSDKLGPIR